MRLIARNNEVLATTRTDAAGRVPFEPGLTRGEGGLAPAMLVAEAKGDYAFLNLKGPAFDLSDRGVSGRTAPAGLDAFIYTERGVYRSGETVQVTALLRDSQARRAQPAADAGGQAAGRGGVPPRRGARPGRRRPLAQRADQRPPDRHLARPAYVDPKRQPVGDASFLVEDYVPDEWSST